MKKQYISPQTRLVATYAETEMLAGSNFRATLKSFEEGDNHKDNDDQLTFGPLTGGVEEDEE